MPQSINYMYGKGNFAHSSFSIAIFSLRPPFARSFIGQKYKGTRSNVHPVSSHPQINGCLYSSYAVDVPDGEIVLIQFGVKSRMVSLRDGAVLIRLRQSGPSLAISANIPMTTESLLGSRVLCFQGAGDMLAPAELVAPYDMPGRYRSQYFDPEELRECFNIQVLREQEAPKPEFTQVTKSDGAVVIVPTESSKRRIRIRPVIDKKSDTA